MNAITIAVIDRTPLYGGLIFVAIGLLICFVAYLIEVWASIRSISKDTRYLMKETVIKDFVGLISVIIAVIGFIAVALGLFMVVVYACMRWG